MWFSGNQLAGKMEKVVSASSTAARVVCLCFQAILPSNMVLALGTSFVRLNPGLNLFEANRSGLSKNGGTSCKNPDPRPHLRSSPPPVQSTPKIAPQMMEWCKFFKIDVVCLRAVLESLRTSPEASEPGAFTAMVESSAWTSATEANSRQLILRWIESPVKLPMEAYIILYRWQFLCCQDLACRLPETCLVC